jgi:glycyl-tRNA synthetase beta chain
VAGFERRMDGKAEALFHTSTVAGAKLAEVLAGIVQDALKALPIPKVMRWGDGDATFVRPAHKLTMLHGTSVVPGSVLDIQSGRSTRGHRFMSRGDIDIASADAYEPTLLAEGKVIPDFAERRADIEKQLVTEAGRQGATLGEYADLLDEVTALVEHPTVYVGEFEAEFLAVPQECLILTMRANQKYFPLFDAEGKLLNRFLIVSNMQMEDPSNIVTGNQRVVRPRLSDARFFFEQDIKAGLTPRVVKLGSVVYHNKLGSLGDRVQRMSIVARKVAALLGADENLANRAALLSKADLLTDMVGEFPELQGTMGRYYALAEGALPVVAEAIEQHYRPRFAGDALPDTNIGRALALADKLDSLVGFFGIGQLPTGDRDPFGLRRAALGVLRILMESPLPLDLVALIDESAASFAGPARQRAARPAVRLHARAPAQPAARSRPCPGRGGRGAGPQAHPHRPGGAQAAGRGGLPAAARGCGPGRGQQAHRQHPQEGRGHPGEPDVALLAEDAEKALFHAIVEVAPLARSHFQNEDYTDALRVLAGLRAAVDRFFDEVMVMAEEPLVRQNRLALLASWPA